MIHWKCPNCHDEKITDDRVIIKLCPCGEYMVEIKEEDYGRGRLQEIK